MIKEILQRLRTKVAQASYDNETSISDNIPASELQAVSEYFADRDISVGYTGANGSIDIVLFWW